MLRHSDRFDGSADPLMANCCHRECAASNLLTDGPMRATQADPITRVVKLIDVVNHGAQLFARTAASTDIGATLQRFAEALHPKLEQFEFELRRELRRLGVEAALTCQASTASLRPACEMILESYRAALVSNVTAHTRAMLSRQFAEMELAYAELASIHHIASGDSHTENVVSAIHVDHFAGNSS